MYEDNLYLSNLTEYLDHKVPEASGDQLAGPDPSDGIRFNNVSFAIRAVIPPRSPGSISTSSQEKVSRLLVKTAVAKRR